MSTAILISGQLRTFAQCYPTQRWHVFRHFPDIHFFITVQDDGNAGDIDILRQHYGDDHVHADFRQDPLLHHPDSYAKAGEFAPYANAAPIGQLLMQHWYQNEVWSHFVTTTYKPAFENNEFDTIIRIRPDQWFHSFDCPPCINGRDNGVFGSDVAFTPWWGRFGGVNDRLAIMGPTAARAYFTVYDRIPELLAEYHCPFHPESLVKAALEVAGCTLHETLRTEFNTLRTDGSHRPPEIMPWDWAHASLRSAA